MPIDVDPVPARGIWYRHVPHRGSVWWQSDPPPDGRWQHGSVIAGLYLADSRETAWAEWYRRLAELGLRPERQLPRDLWRFRVDLEAIADLSNKARLARVGLSRPRPFQRDWPAFQAVGEELHAEGWKGILAPSAARPEGGRILCLFRHGRTVEGVRPVPPAAIYRRPPVPPTGMRT